MLNVKGIDSEILHSIEILGEKDCDLRTITICCNPNYARGSDTELSKVIKSHINELMIADILYIKNHKIHSRNKTSRVKTVFIYQLKNA